jgi:hypothetical protein
MAPAPPPPKPDAAATKVLTDALDQLDPKKVAWLETTIWQQADVQGLTFQTEGKYQSGPDHRLHLDLRVQLGDTLGQLGVVSDGKMVWEEMSAGKNTLRTKLDISKVLEVLPGSGETERLRHDFLLSQSFFGVGPLLQTIKERMTVTQQEKVQRGGKDMIKLTAIWSDANPPSGQWPPYIARQCELFLGSAGPANTLWPYRLEWWGPTRAGDGLLLQMEFRDPKLNQPLPADKVAQVFHFDPGKAEVVDKTKTMVDEYKMHLQQLAAQKQQAAPPGQGAQPAEGATQNK